MKAKNLSTVAPSGLSSTVAVKTANRPIEVFSIGENVLRLPGLNYYMTGLTIISDRSNVKKLEPRDPRHWLNPARYFSAPKALNYCTSDYAKISLNTGIEDLVITVHDSPRCGKAYFVIKVARVFAGMAVEIYDTLLISVDKTGKVEFIRSYRASDLLGSKSRVDGLDDFRADLKVVLPTVLMSALVSSKPAVDRMVSLRSVWARSSAIKDDTVNPPEMVPAAEIMYYSDSAARNLVQRLDPITLCKLMKSNNYTMLVGGKSYYCRPCSPFSTDVWYSSISAVVDNEIKKDYIDDLVIFIKACKAGHPVFTREGIKVNLLSLKYLFEHKFLKTRRSLNEKEANDFYDRMIDNFEDSVVVCSSSEHLYIPAGTRTKDGELEKPYLLTYHAAIENKDLKPNLRLLNIILGAAGKATYKTLAELEESLALTYFGHEAGGSAAGAGADCKFRTMVGGSPGDDRDGHVVDLGRSSTAYKVRGAAAGAGIEDSSAAYKEMSAAGVFPR